MVDYSLCHFSLNIENEKDKRGRLLQFASTATGQFSPMFSVFERKVRILVTSFSPWEQVPGALIPLPWRIGTFKFSFIELWELRLY